MEYMALHYCGNSWIYCNGQCQACTVQAEYFYSTSTLVVKEAEGK